ncbi:TIGR02588 family protein [Phyllobacterium salinisoli]|uniref:TIGR02588 family protein n=1 Tax=Phyllobacterium salinisoli TaxID=1899321 RepID=A0A368K9N9_9HYPH|nr:TIGR02588 family protein [Phyllobacterium salinisoli]RCS25112.1 TIGR02588 family protein [Phyllobacterium salinisoli]
MAGKTEQPKAKMPNAAVKEGAAHPVEWIVGAISMLIISGLLGFLLYDAIFAPSEPPRFTYDIGKTKRTDGTFRIPVAITNRGTETAAGVHLRGTLERNGAVVETSEIEFDYVPRNSMRDGVLFFSADPDTAHLRLMVVGYDNP